MNEVGLVGDSSSDELGKRRRKKRLFGTSVRAPMVQLNTRRTTFSALLFWETPTSLSLLTPLSIRVAAATFVRLLLLLLLVAAAGACWPVSAER
jgi:hypothetical protein